MPTAWVRAQRQVPRRVPRSEPAHTRTRAPARARGSATCSSSKGSLGFVEIDAAWRGACPSEGARRASSLSQRVEREVQLEHVDTRLAEKTEPLFLRSLADEGADALDGQTPGVGDARRLVLGSSDAGLRVEIGRASCR